MGLKVWTRLALALLVTQVLILSSASAQGSSDALWKPQNSDVRYGDPYEACEQAFSVFTDEPIISFGFSQNRYGQIYRITCSNPDTLIGWAFATLECQNGTRFTGDMTFCGDPQPVMPSASNEVCTAFTPDEMIGTNTTPMPIHIPTGAKLETAVDYSTADGLLSFSRSYSTKPLRGTEHGFGWRNSFTRTWVGKGNATTGGNKIQLGGHTVLHYDRRIWDNGYVKYYPLRLSSRGYLPNWSNHIDEPYHEVEEVSAPGHVYELTYPDGTVENYNSGRKLIALKYPGGYTQEIDRSIPGEWTITDNLGRSLIVTFSTDTSLLESVETPDGQLITYEYEQFSDASLAENASPSSLRGGFRLTRVVYPDDTPADRSDNPSVQYHYEHVDRPGYLTGITDERGIRIKTTTFDGYRAISSEGAGGRLNHSVSTTPNPETFTVTGPLGKTHDHEYGKYRGVLRHLRARGNASAATPAALSRKGFDDGDGVYHAMRDKHDVRTAWVKDGRGLPTETTYDDGGLNEYTIYATWHPDYAVPTEIDSPLTLETYAYNSDGALTSAAITDKAGGTTRTTSYTYLPGGLVDTINGPLPGASDTVDFDYSTEGYVSRITDANGLVTDITAHNGRGQPETIIAPNGLVTTLAYNARGWLTSSTVDPSGAARTTSFEHDAAGNITRVTLPTGGYYDYAYEGNSWITSITSSNGEQISFTHDNAGNVLSRTISGAGATGFSIQTDYDDLSRMIRSINALGETTSYSYDHEDRITSITDPAGKVWGSTFDSLGRVIRATDPESDAIDLTYDNNHVVTDFEDARDLSTAYVRNGFGEVTQETSPDRGVTTYAYDSAGRMTRRTDADGDETLYAYDAGGRITARTFTSDPALNQSFVYDIGTNAAGFLTQVTDTHGITTYTYNKTGELTSETRTLGTQSYVTSYTYSPLGQVETITYPSGREMRVTHDPLGRVTRMETLASGAGTWEDLATAFDWKPFGPLAGYTSGNGVTNDRDVDAAYRLDRLRVDNGQTLLMDKTIGRDTVGRVNAITDALDTTRSASFEYTDDGRLSRAVGLWGDRRWTYDPVGNRLNEANHDGAGTLLTEADYAYPASSNQLEDVDDGLGSPLRAFTHSASGDITTDVRSGSGTYDYIYDAAGRLQEVRKDGATEATYGYDAFERRVTREITNGASVHYIFDQSGRPLAEHDATTGALIREYHWLGDLLIATSDTFETAFVHGGHLGQPLLMTDAAGAVVWDAEYNPFGGALPQSSLVETDLRFPGQWAQGEADLHQNWHRDYDPSLGRYIQADPLGMTAGQSIYGYVGQDPVNWVDPDGLQAVPVPVPGKRDRPWWWWYDEPRSEADELFKDLTGRYPSRGSDLGDSCIAPPLTMEGDFDPPANRCEEQANRDFLVCRALPRSLRRRCWEDAHRDFAECLKNL